MYKIADQTHDPGFSLLREMVERFPHLKEMSKTAELDDSEFINLPDSAFAWPAQRMFPIHSKEHTALSLGYRKYASVVPSDVDAILNKAADIYDIDPLLYNNVATEKQASEEHWLLEEKKRFRVTCAEDVKIAEEIIHQRYQQLPLEDRTEAMFNLVKIAQHFNVSISPSTQKLGAFTITSTQILKNYIGARKIAACKLNSETEKIYEQLEQSFTNTVPYIKDKDYQVKLSETLLALDKKTGLDKLYGIALPDPIQSVWNTTKLAQNQIELNGTLFDKNKLATVPLTFWEDALGEDVISEIAPNGTIDTNLLAQVLTTLPQDAKTNLVTQLAPYAQ
jgi:hypothetical protein